MTTTNTSLELACTLTDAELRERRAMVRKRMLQHVVICELNDLNLSMQFSSTDILRSELELFVDLERQCCGFLNFTISPPGEKLTLTLVGPEGSQSTLKIFADTAGGTK